MNCDLNMSQLQAYVDESLGPQEREAVEAHLDQCSDCAKESLRLMQEKRAVRAAGADFAMRPEFAMHPEFRAQIARIATKNSAQRRPLWKTSWLTWAWAAALALLLVAGFAFVSARRANNRQAMAELLDLHLATLASANPVDVISTDRHTVKPWFQGKLPFTFNVPELANTQFRLLGGKLVYVGDRPAAELVFELRKHQISAFIAQDAATPLHRASPSIAALENGFAVESWNASGVRYTVIGDAGPSDVHALAELLRNAQEPPAQQ